MSLGVTPSDGDRVVGLVADRVHADLRLLVADNSDTHTRG